MCSLLLCVVLSQSPVHTTSELVFRRDQIGQVWAETQTGNEWLPVKGALPRGVVVKEFSSVDAYTSGPGDAVPKPVGAKTGPGNGGGGGTGGGKGRAAATPAGTIKPATSESVIQKLAAAPKPPDTGNGGVQRWEYVNKRADAVESAVAELRQEVALLRAALEGIVKILEKQQ